MALMPPMGPALTAFGVPATVTEVGAAPVVTTVIFHTQATPPAVGSVGMGSQASVDLRDVVAVLRADVPKLSVGATIYAAKASETARVRRVDRVDGLRPDEWRCVVS